MSDMICKSLRTNTSEGKESNEVKQAMLDSGIPFPLCRLVLDLLDNANGKVFHSNSSFASFRDVLSDLEQMINNPSGFLYGSNHDRWKLVFGDKLYGRDTEMTALLDAANRVTGQNNDPILNQLGKLAGKKTEMIMVSGNPGSGKSRIVRAVGKILEKRGWQIMQCKFDRLVHSEPLSIIANAFDDFLGHYYVYGSMIPSNEDQSLRQSDTHATKSDRFRARERLCIRLRYSIKLENLEMLAVHVPLLRAILDIAVPSILPDVNTAVMTELFSALLKAISSEESPIFFFIDDLQWCDPLSLSLLMSFVKGDQVETMPLSSKHVEAFDLESDPCIIFVMSYRENEVEENLPLSKALNEILSSNSIILTNISLSGITIDALTEMLSDSLCTPKRRVQSLSELVIQKTDGLPLHVIELLRALKADKLLNHSLTGGWEWDEDLINIFPLSDSVAELFALKLQRLPKDILLGLQITSIFGTQVDQQIIELVKNYDGKNSVDISASLNVALKEGMIERAANIFRFSHDLIQKATIDSICEDYRAVLLHKLVLSLVNKSSATNLLDDVLFVIVDLVNRLGCNLISDNSERALFADLNLRAGVKAVAVPDFASAAIYAESGISFLSETCWETQYDLSLQLHEIAIQAHFSINTDNQDLLMKRIKTVFEKARSFSDKFNTHRVWIQVLAISQLPDAIEQCLIALNHLGEPLNVSNVGYGEACKELTNHNARFSGKSMLTVPLNDLNKMRAMIIMSSLILYYNQQRSYLSAIVSCRMVEMSENCGYCADSIYGAAAFAVSLVTCLGDIDGGYSWGRKLLDLMKSYGTPSLTPIIRAALYGFVFVWKEPFQSTLDGLAEGIRCSFIYGNVEYSKAFTQIYISRSFNIGKSLRVLAEEVDTLSRQHGVRFGADLSSDATNQFILSYFFNIIRSLEDDSTFNGADSLHDVLKDAIVCGNSSMLYYIVSMQTAKEFMFRNMDKALKSTDIYFDTFGSKIFQMTYIYIFNVFYDGLINFHFAFSTTGNTRHLERGERALLQVREWMKYSDWNFQNKFLLLGAEYYRVTNNATCAATCYNSSIRAAKEHKFIHEEAMANELAGIFFFDQGDCNASLSYFKEASECYRKWGALAIARKIDVRIEAIINKSINMNIVPSFSSQAV